MNKPTCATCPFWERFKASKSLPADGGLCRIGRPVIGHPIGWRPTNAADWCGEHPGFRAFLEEAANPLIDPPRCERTWRDEVSRVTLRCDRKAGHDDPHNFVR